MAFIPDKHRKAFERQPEAPQLTPEQQHQLNKRLEGIQRRQFYKTIQREKKIQELRQQLEALGG